MLTKEDLQAIAEMMDQKLVPIKEEIALARRENNETRSIIETQICHSIDLLVEGHKEILATIKRDFVDKRQLDQERVRIYALEETVTEHTAQIQELQQDLQRKTG